MYFSLLLTHPIADFFLQKGEKKVKLKVFSVLAPTHTHALKKTTLQKFSEYVE
jgi:hypothetical protein